MMIYKIWYMTPLFFREGTMGVDWLREHNFMPDISNLEKTHIFLKEIEATDLEQVFVMMQGEVWSPNGEARNLIQSKGLSHTSMSVGDIVQEENGKVQICDNFGFVELN